MHEIVTLITTLFEEQCGGAGAITFGSFKSVVFIRIPSLTSVARAIPVSAITGGSGDCYGHIPALSSGPEREELTGHTNRRTSRIAVCLLLLLKPVVCLCM